MVITNIELGFPGLVGGVLPAFRTGWSVRPPSRKSVEVLSATLARG